MGDEYIAGREVRAACVEEADGTLTVLPKIEYFLKDIRTSAHKLATDQSGKLKSDAIQAAKRDGDRQCPADLSPVLHERINTMVKEAHRVLKCRHYSLYDLRIDANEQPYILEAALFCSFSPLSVIPAMAQHAGREDLRHPNLFQGLLERAAKPAPAVDSADSVTAATLSRSVSDAHSAESEPSGSSDSP